jgi:hypothetical protein
MVRKILGCPSASPPPSQLTVFLPVGITWAGSIVSTPPFLTSDTTPEGAQTAREGLRNFQPPARDNFNSVSNIMENKFIYRVVTKRTDVNARI